MNILVSDEPEKVVYCLTIDDLCETFIFENKEQALKTALKLYLKQCKEVAPYEAATVEEMSCDINSLYQNMDIEDFCWIEEKALIRKESEVTV